MSKTNFLLAASAIAWASCQAPLPKNEQFWASDTAKIKAANPVDIAVMPPTDSTNRVAGLAGLAPSSLPVKEIRKIAYQTLLKNRYSPLSLDFVDAAFAGKATAAEASYSEIRERCDADAILNLTVNRWDMSRLNGDKLLSLGMEAYLVDAKTGETIWQGRADWDIDLSSERDIERVATDELRERGIRRFLDRFLSQIPKRDL